MPERICPNCDKAFNVKPCRADRTNYCSQKCYQEHRGQRVEAVCEQCGDVRLVVRSRADRRYCSMRCRNEAYTGQQRVDPEVRAEKIRVKNRNHYYRHRDHYIAENRRRYSDNKEALRKRRLELMTPERRAVESERSKRWSRANPERVRMHRNKRRARIANATLRDVSHEDWIGILGYYGNACAYCGSHGRGITQDHIVPLSGGGEHSIDNIAPACKSCNSRKSTSSLLAWLARST